MKKILAIFIFSSSLVAQIANPSGGSFTPPVGTVTSGLNISFPGNVQGALHDTGGMKWDVQALGASGSLQTTTGTGTATQSTITLASAIDFKVGQYLKFRFAGLAGGSYFGKITAINSLVVSVTPALTGTSNGNTVSHVDGTAINALYDLVEAAGGGTIYYPCGSYNLADQALHKHNNSVREEAENRDCATFYSDGEDNKGPQLVDVGASLASYTSAGYSFPAALLTGTGNSWSLAGASTYFIDLRDSQSADINNDTQQTWEATVNLTGNPGSGNKAGILTSGGIRDNRRGYKSAGSLYVTNPSGTSVLEGKFCLSTAQNDTVLAVSAYAISGNTITFTTSGNAFVSGQKVEIEGFGTSTFLNGQVLTLGGTINSTSFQAGIVRADTSGTVTEAGRAIATCTTYTVTGTTAITTAANHHAALTYDASNVKLWLDGTSEGTPQACSSCYLGQDVTEQFTVGRDVASFPEGGTQNYSAINGKIDAIRISNISRYSSNFTKPAAKWTYPVGSNARVVLNFDNQQDLFTIGQTGVTGDGNPQEAIWYPVHRTDACPGGVDTADWRDINWGGRDGVYIVGGSGIKLRNLEISSSHNGIITGNCTFQVHITDLDLNTSGRYGLATMQGLMHVDTVNDLQGSTIYPVIHKAPSGHFENYEIQLGGTQRIGIIMAAAGSPGSSPVLSQIYNDCESDPANFITPLLLDDLDSIIINGSQFYTSCLTRAAPAIQLQYNTVATGVISNGTTLSVSSSQNQFINVKNATPALNPQVILNNPIPGQAKNYADCIGCVKLSGRLPTAGDTSVIGTWPDYLFNDAPNKLSIRNGSNAQKVDVYGSYTDASNYDRISLDMAAVSDRATLSNTHAGSGATRDLWMVSDRNIVSYSTSAINWTVGNGAASWKLDTTAGYPIYPATDNAQDFGIDSTNRIRSGYFGTSVKSAAYNTGTNCSSSASPAVCAAASAGSVVIAASATTVTVNTTAVTANSQIFLQPDDSLGTKLGVTCNTTGTLLDAQAWVSARTAATSFVITVNAAPSVNPECFSYFIVN